MRNIARVVFYINCSVFYRYYYTTVLVIIIVPSLAGTFNRWSLFSFKLINYIILGWITILRCFFSYRKQKFSVQIFRLSVLSFSFKIIILILIVITIIVVSSCRILEDILQNKNYSFRRVATAVKKIKMQ